MAKIRRYKDFKLVISDYKEAGGSFRVSLSGDDWGEIEVKSRIKLDDDEIQTSLGRIESRGELRQESLIDLGKTLAKSLVPGEIGAKFKAAVSACSTDEGIRLRLAIQDVALQQVPWEYTYLKMVEGVEDRTHFLSLTPKVSMVRHPPMAEAVPPLEVADPGKLRLLPVLAQPKDQAKLDLGLEKSVLKDALTDLQVDDVQVELLPFVENATFADLQKALGKKPEMFHFAGHGEFGETDDTGSLILLDDKKKKNSAPLPAPELGGLLAASGVRLAYLGACLTSRVQGKSPWASIANRVVAAGVPAVLAMQYEVKDSAATQFCAAFYTTLASGLTVDEAVLAGRLAVLNNSGTSDIQWGIPTLYLRAQDGVLFKQVTEAESKTAEKIRLAVNMIIKTVEGGSSVTGLEMTGGVAPGDFDVKMNIDKVTGGSQVVGAKIDLASLMGKKKP